MSVVSDRSATAAAAESVAPKKSKGFFTALFEIITDSQMQRAGRDVDCHLGMLPEQVREERRRALRRKVDRDRA